MLACLMFKINTITTFLGSRNLGSLQAFVETLFNPGSSTYLIATYQFLEHIENKAGIFFFLVELQV